MHHGRIPWPTPSELNAEQRQVYEGIIGGPRAVASAFALTDAAGRLEGPFNAMLLSPAIGTATQELGSAIRYRGALTDREREIAILTLAALRRSEFEWYAHELVGARVGLNDSELSAIECGVGIASFTPMEALVQEITTSLVSSRDLSDPLFSRSRDLLGYARLAELVALVGYYDLLALGLTVWRTPLPEGETPRFSSEHSGWDRER